jgi:hypothetical protein
MRSPEAFREPIVYWRENLSRIVAPILRKPSEAGHSFGENLEQVRSHR